MFIDPTLVKCMDLSNITIQGFRGLDNLTIEHMNRITVFVGRNNVGKSACLEAICLLKSGKDRFRDALGNDLIKPIIFRKTKDQMAWDYLIHKGNKQTHISGYEKNDKKKISVTVLRDNIKKTVDKSISSELREKRSRLLDDSLEYRHRRRSDEWDIINRGSVYYKGEVESVAELFTIGGRPHIETASNYRNEEEYDTKTLFLTNSEHIEVVLHDRLAQTKKLHNALDSLSATISKFKDLRKVEDHLRIFYNDNSMPFFAMGDGIKASIISTLTIHAIGRGTVIMEEPENFLHPGLLNNLVHEMVLAARSHKAQFFLSTHSTELLEYLLDSGSTDITVIQLNELNGIVSACIMDRETAQKRMKGIGIDLRGS